LRWEERKKYRLPLPHLLVGNKRGGEFESPGKEKKEKNTEEEGKR